MFRLIDDNEFRFIASAVIIVIAIILSFTGFGVFGIKTNPNIYKCNQTRSIKKSAFFGIVNDKYKGNHAAKVIELLNDENINEIYSLNDNTQFYDYLKKGDFISKRKNTLAVTIIRNQDTLTRILDYGCNP